MATQYATIARRYAEAVVEGSIPACRWVKLACQRQLNDLAKFRGKSSPFQFNPMREVDYGGPAERPLS